MKIAYLANARMPTEKAHGLQIMHMCRAFSQVGHDVTLIVPGRKNWIDKSIWEFYSIEPCFKVVYVPVVDFIVWDKWLGNFGLWLTSAWFGMNARRVIEDLKPDAVYSRDPFSSAWSPRWIPNIFEAHTFPNRALPLYRWLWKRCDRIVSVTHGLSKMFKEQGIPESRLRVAADAVDLEQFTVTESKEECRKLLHLPQDKFLVVYAGHLYPYKGIPDLMKAAPMLHPDIRVVVVGGRNEDLERTKKLAEKVGAKNVIFVGRVPHKDIPRYLAAGDLAVMPYTRESHHVEYYSSPLKLFEYLAAGRAIITTDLPSVREVLDDTTAEFVPAEQPKAIADGINRLHANPARLKELEGHSTRLGKMYTWKNRAEAVLEALPKPKVEWKPNFFRTYRLEFNLALLALAIRLVYVVFFPQHTIAGGDGEFYIAVADWIRGKEAWHPEWQAFFQPGYPYLLAAVRTVFGEALVWGRVVQAFLSAGTVFMMAMIARRWISPYAAWIAGLIGALYVPAILESGIYYTETTYTFLLTLAVFAFAWAIEKPDVRRGLLVGAAFAATGLVREIGFYLGAIIPFFTRATRRPAFVAAMLIPVLLTIGMLSARNRSVAERLPETENAPLISKGYEKQLTNPAFIKNATRADRLALYPVYAFRFFWLPFRLNDVTVTNVSAKQAILSGDVKTIAANWDSIGVKSFLVLFHWFILVLAVIGVARGGLRKDLKWTFVLVVAFAMATIVLQSIGNTGARVSQYEPLARYRFPTEPLIIILAAAGIERLTRKRNVEETHLWEEVPQALRRFNVKNLSRTAFSAVRVAMGLERLTDQTRPVLLSFSISEDYARVWFHFAKKALGGKWQIVIGDSSGVMDPKKFPEARVIRVPNQMYHGAKIDFMLKHVIGDQPVFLSDDDKYLLADPSKYLETLKDAAAVSLCPRTYYVFRIDGKDYQPMGSYAILFKPSVIRELGLKFQSPAKIISPYKVFVEGTKPNSAYDTADFANEQLLLKGQRIVTETSDSVLGFDGMSAPRILLQELGKDRVKAALVNAEHYNNNSVNGAVMRGISCIIAFEKLYRRIFKEEPVFVSGFSAEELKAIVEGNPRLDAESKERLFSYFRDIDERLRRLESI